MRKANTQKIQHQIKEGETSGFKRLLDDNPQSPIDKLFHGIGWLTLDENIISGKLIGEAIIHNSEWLTANWLHNNFIDLIIQKRNNFTIHPWLMLQAAYRRFIQGSRNESYDLAYLALQDTNIACLNIRYRLFEILCESFLSQSSLSEAKTLSKLIYLLDKEDPFHEKPWCEIYRGCIAYAKGNVDESELNFKRFSRSNLKKSHIAIGSNTFLPTSTKSELSTFKAHKAPLIKYKSEECHFVFTADPVYYQKFHTLLIQSAFAHKVDGKIHFHIIGKLNTITPSCLHVPDNWIANNISFSFEDDPMTGKSYYASARLLNGAKIMKSLKTNCVFLDIDCYFVNNARKLTTRLKNKQGLLLMKSKDNHFPWRSISAGQIALPYTDDSIEFMNLARMHTLGWMDELKRSNLRTWWGDQNSLAITYQKISPQFKKSLAGSRMGLVPVEFALNNNERKNEFIVINSQKIKKLILKS